MDIAKLRSQPHLSASAISEYIDCGLSYKFSRIDKIQPEFTSDALEFGSVIHKVLQNYYQKKMTGEIMALDEVLSLFEEYWKEVGESSLNIQYKDGKDFEALLRDGKEMLKIYYEKQPHDDFTILAIEEPFSFLIEGLPIPIVGVIDLMEQDESGTVIITDFKTSSKSYSADEVDNSQQLTIYNMAVNANGYRDREILLRFDVLIKTKVPKFEQYYTTRSNEDMKRITKRILSVWDGIRKGVFIPNDTNWKCKGCFYKNHCNEWFRR